ncbi:MAG: chemotaxis protein CheW [Synergistaceae bacterium]|nr:chemotaxis protein CheW [Synergistaceae bacterium]
MRGLSFFADGELFAVDAALVKKVVRNVAFTPIPAAPEAVAGIAGIKGRIVTVLSLAELLGRKRDAQVVKPAKAVVFKPLTDGGDQMGLLIDKPGGLIDIDENKILPLPRAAEDEEKLCVSGMAEVEGILYRIINVDSIINRFEEGEIYDE